MKRYILFLVLTVCLYAGNSSLKIVNKLDFNVVLDVSNGGVNYMYDTNRPKGQVHLFPGESVSYNIQCNKKVEFTAMKETELRHFEIKFIPKCGKSYTWNIIYQDESK